MEKINKIINTFIKEEKNLTKKIKNLIIECIQKSAIEYSDLKEKQEYEIWSIYPGCTLTYKGIDKILEITKKFNINSCHLEYNIYGHYGMISSVIFIEIGLKDKIYNMFLSKGLDSKIVKMILDYLYSGKSLETINHYTWEEAIKNYI